jgi:hypothetical protein
VCLFISEGASPARSRDEHESSARGGAKGQGAKKRGREETRGDAEGGKEKKGSSETTSAPSR